jgi:preprotein translocase SecE subunit
MTTTKDSQGNPTMTAADKPQQPTRPSKTPPGYPPPGDRGPGTGSSPAGGGGYFTIYKKGQGYWTRMGTVIAVALIGILAGHFIWQEHVLFNMTDHMAYLVIGIFSLVYAGLAFHVINRPSNVDFLIATDSEMKRVNWTTQKDLYGSTKVVIGFVFIVACVLFLYDLFFQTVFYLVGVLKTPPPFFPVKH